MPQSSLDGTPVHTPLQLRSGLTVLSVAAITAATMVAAGCSSTAASTDDDPAEQVITIAEGVTGLDEVEMGGLEFQTSAGDIQTIAPGQYSRPIAEGDEAALVLEGLVGVTVDLSGVELRGQDAGADIDEASGIGLLLRNCDDVTLRGGLIGGYKGCVVVENSTNITLDRIRFDGWYGQYLRSTTFSEDQTDWLYPHRNDDGEWITNYGAAISVTDCTDVTVKNCRGRRGQNGILLTRVAESRVFDNDFSFLSGWGLGMYRAVKNTVSHNVFDYCVRGYSHDVYWRGQDSAGILMFERCCDNVIARNSATHSGDGIFLFGGNDIVERGLDDATGSDGNLFFGNDLRYSVANSLEATFSRGNVVIGNDLSGSHQHGIWGGYSSEMVIIDNDIEDTIGGGVTIEHGQDCVIADNRLEGNEIGIELYWDEDPHLVDGPFGQKHDTSSRSHVVLENAFKDNVLDLVLRDSTSLVFHANQYIPGSREPYFERVSAESDPTLETATVQRWLDALDGAYPSGSLSDVSLEPWVGQTPEVLAQWRAWEAPSLPGRQQVRAEQRDDFGGGLESIVMGEWGPWDFRSGEPRPAVRKAGGLLADATWSAIWFEWEPGLSDPRTNESAWRARANAPIVTDEVGTFTNPWSNETHRRTIGNDHFGLFAQTELVLSKAGTYRLSVNSDDGIRVFVDGELMIEDWTHHAGKRDDRTMILEAGVHVIRLEYFQIQGGAALVVDLSPE